MRRVDGADTHQRRDNRQVQIGCEPAQLVGRVAVHDAAACIDERALRLAQHFEESACGRLVEHAVL